MSRNHRVVWQSFNWQGMVIEGALHKFYEAANSIYSNSKYASEILKLYLMDSYIVFR